MTKGSHAHANHAHATLEKLERARLNGSAANGAEKGQLHLRSAAQGSVSSLTSAAQRGARLALLSMFLLVLQGTALSIALRYSRVKAGTPYLASVSVLLTETAKLLICLGVQLRNCRQAALEEGEDALVVREFRKQMHLILSQALPMLLPAGMFVMQQVLLIIAATHLDAVAFQIFSQSFKLVPTAFFAYWLLGQHLEPIQWASIPVLAAGVILVTINNGAPGGSAGAALAAKKAAAAKAAALAAVNGDGVGNLGWLVGMVTCSISGLSSAYAGVYFEKYVKGKNAASLWVRNIQLGVFGVPLSAAYMAVKDARLIRKGGFMQGFDASAWLVVALQVFGGLVTGMVVKYCDNILKNFALAISVVLTVLLCIPLFGMWPSGFFLLGVALVLLSVFMYGKAVNSDTPRALWHWCRNTCLPWLGEDTVAKRQVLCLVLAGCLAAGGILGIYGMQRAVTNGIVVPPRKWQAQVVATTQKGGNGVLTRQGAQTLQQAARQGGQTLQQAAKQGAQALQQAVKQGGQVLQQAAKQATRQGAQTLQQAKDQIGMRAAAGGARVAAAARKP